MNVAGTRASPSRRRPQASRPESTGTDVPTVSAPADTFTGIFSVTGGTATSVQYGYDGHGNQHSHTEANGNVWTSQYDLLGRVTAKTDPDAGTMTGLAYDGNGNLLESTDSRTKTVSSTYDALNRKTGQYAASVAAQAPANQLAAWVYDNSNNAVPTMTYPKGHLTTATAFWNEQAYKVQAKGFNVFGKSTGETVTIPAAEGLLAGDYIFSHLNTATNGLLLKDIYPSKGGLPAETVLHAYNAFDMPTTLGGLNGYAQGVTYDAYSRINQATIGAAPNLAYITNTYDDHTGRLTQQLLTRAVATPTNVDQQYYRYDLAGNITRQISTRLGTTTNSGNPVLHLRPAPTPQPGLDRHRQLRRHADTRQPRHGRQHHRRQQRLLDQLAINNVGNRTSQTQYSLTGGADTTTTYTYNGNGTNQPHTLTATTTSGGTPGTTSYGYDTDGTMTSRNAGQGNQTLTWNNPGQLTAITGSTGGPSTFLYDNDGNLLLQKDPGKTALYLPNAQQHTLNTATQTVTGARHYQLPGGGTCIRTGTGTNYTYALTEPPRVPWRPQLLAPATSRGWG